MRSPSNSSAGERVKFLSAYRLGPSARRNELATRGAEPGCRAWVETSPAPYSAVTGRPEAPLGHALLGRFLPEMTAGAFGLRPLWELPDRLLGTACCLLGQRGFVRGLCVGLTVSAPVWWSFYRLACLCGGL